MTPEILAENGDWKPKYVTADNKLVLCIQSYLVRTGKQNILIDTCVGNHKERPTRAFWHQMKSQQYGNAISPPPVSR